MNLSWLLPEAKGIPVLMYHRVWPGAEDDLAISPERLRQQWEYLKQVGYHSLSLPVYLDIVTGKGAAPAKSVLITFDDGYRNNLLYAYPLLKEIGLQATFFIIGNMLDEIAAIETDAITQKMSVEELRSLDTGTVQLAMHGYAHKDLGKINAAEMSAEINSAVKAFEESRLSYHKVWAFAYGARPAAMSELKKLMRSADIKAAFRIGNKVSRVPTTDIYELKRIDIKGTDTMEEFKIKLRKGRLKPF